jgi:hypothetical protein
VNRQFQRKIKREVLRPEINVESLTLIHIDEFENMIDSAEGTEFDFLGTLQLRNFRDPDGMSELTDLLLSSKGYAKQRSTHRTKLEAEFERCVLRYAFDPENTPNVD